MFLSLMDRGSIQLDTVILCHRGVMHNIMTNLIVNLQVENYALLVGRTHYDVLVGAFLLSEGITADTSRSVVWS